MQELTRIASNQRSQADAGTLTDEELCAAIDKDSGFIRFTLRKRRNNQDEDSEFSLSSQQIPSTNIEGASGASRQVGEVSIKKTKLNPSPSVERSLADQVANLVDAQLNAIETKSEISSKLNSNVNETSDDNKQPHHDYNNNNNEGNLSITHKQNIQKLKQWFSLNLAGLVEYSTMFLQNGFDNLEFLNHSELMNDHLLKSMGIDNESHRVLVIECVRNELPMVNFAQLFKEIDGNEWDQRLSLKVLQILQLGQLIGDVNCKLDSIEQLKSIAESLDQPLGYRVRLSVALDTLAEKQSTQQNHNSLNKQASTESNDMELDTSQASATSSSSKESIKSIVLVKPVEVDELEATKSERPDTDDNCKTKNTHKENEIVREDSKQQTTDRPQMVGKASSLVSEVARRLEAAAAQKSFESNQKPVAALRRINNNNNIIIKPSNAQPKSAIDNTKSSQLKSPSAKQFVPVKSVCWPPKNTSLQSDKVVQNHQLKEPAISSELINIKMTHLKQGQYDRNSGVYNNSLTGAATQGVNKLRPKPAPPAKPAKLVAVGNKLSNIDLNNKL